MEHSKNKDISAQAQMPHIRYFSPRSTPQSDSSLKKNVVAGHEL